MSSVSAMSNILNCLTQTIPINLNDLSLFHNCHTTHDLLSLSLDKNKKNFLFLFLIFLQPIAKALLSLSALPFFLFPFFPKDEFIIGRFKSETSRSLKQGKQVSLASTVYSPYIFKNSCFPPSLYLSLQTWIFSVYYSPCGHVPSLCCHS